MAERTLLEPLHSRDFEPTREVNHPMKRP